MQWMPKPGTEIWNRIEKPLFELTGQTMEELFPETVRNDDVFLKSTKRLSIETCVRSGAINVAAIDRTAENDEAIVESKRIMHKALGLLGPTQRRVLDMRFGLSGGNAMTQVEIAEVLGLSSQRISQILSGAIFRLQCRANSILMPLLDDHWQTPRETFEQKRRSLIRQLEQGYQDGAAKITSRGGRSLSQE